MPLPLLEIACFNAESALIAQAAGADRIELCKDQQLGGTTPLLSTFQELKREAKLPVNVMIRPRGGNFIYDVEELHQMETELDMLREAGVDGFVFGILDGGKVDFERCRFLVERALGKPCTFHRAFDEISEDEMLEQLEVLIACGFRSVLTSGGQENAAAGSEVLRALVEAAHERIDIIVGGGVRSTNLQALAEKTRARIFHSSAIIRNDELADTGEIRALKSIIKQI